MTTTIMKGTLCRLLEDACIELFSKETTMSFFDTYMRENKNSKVLNK
jgi:hypothetical protein